MLVCTPLGRARGGTVRQDGGEGGRIKYVQPDKYVQAGGLFIVGFLRTEKPADPTGE